MTMKKKSSHEKSRTETVADLEVGLAAFRSLRSASEERTEMLMELVEPYREVILDALHRGTSKKAVLSTLNGLIGRRLNAKKLDDLLGGGTMRGKSKGGASLLIGASATQAKSNGEAT